MMANFTLTRADVQTYASKNKYAAMMFVSAGDDYTAARCLILNELSYGFTLFAQSIEKLLKAFIYLETGKPTLLHGRNKHNPFALKEELQSHKDYGLTKYDVLLTRLYGHFQQRYYDNPDKSQSMRSSELPEFDELWVYLLDRIPVPTEVKYRLKFLTELFDKQSLDFWPNYRLWTTRNNAALSASRLQEMAETYAAVKKHLYPE